MKRVVDTHLSHLFLSVFCACQKRDFIVIGKIDDCCYTAKGSKLTCFQERICCNSAPTYKMIMSMGINNARKNTSAGSIYNVCVFGAIFSVNISRNSLNAGSFNQNIAVSGPFGIHHKTIFNQ